MGWDDDNYKWDELWDQMSKELYPEHKELAIEEFTTERLQSFYLKNPNILAPGIHMYSEANESLAEIIVQTALGASGFERYKKLLTGIFLELVSIDRNKVKNSSSGKYLLQEASAVQKMRNKVIHQGIHVDKNAADFAIGVAYGILYHIVNPILISIGLWMDKKGTVRKEGK